MAYDPYSIDDMEIEALRAERRRERQYHNAFMRHPDCRDPDHPGCDQCMPEEFGVTNVGHNEEESE